MADYPSISQHNGTVVEPVEGPVKVMKTSNGSILLYDLGDGAADWYNIVIFHRQRTLTDRDSVIAHYNANKSLGFNWIYNGDSQVYSCNYIGKRPTYVWRSGNTWDITTQLVGTV